MAGHFVQKLAVELANRGHAIKVWAPNDGLHPEQSLEGPIEVHRFDYPPRRRAKKLVYGQGILPNLKAQPIAALELPAFIKALNKAGADASMNCDLVHAHWTVSGRGVAPDIPLVVSARGSDLSGAGGPMIQRISEKILKKASAVIAENETLAKTARIHCDTVHVLGNGVDLNRYTARHDRSILKGTALADKRVIFLFVGRLSHVKGADRLIKALSNMSHDPHWGMIFVGEGPLRSLIENAGISNRILLTGELPTNEVINFYHAADALVVTSRYEGRPNNVLEAFSCGLPVVSLNIPGVTEMIKPGNNGFLIEGHHTEDIARGLYDFMSQANGQLALREQARAYAEAHFDWKIITEAYEQVYAKVLETQ